MSSGKPDMPFRANLKLWVWLLALTFAAHALAPSSQAQVINDLLQRKKVEDDRRRMDQETQAARKAAQHDVIGLKIGMPLAEAEKLVRAHMNVDRVMTFERPTIIAPDTKIIPYTSGTFYVDAEGRETITLFNEPPAAPDTLVAVMRTITQAPGAMPGAALLASLREKYGAETRLLSNGTEFEAAWIPRATQLAATPTFQWCVDSADRLSPYSVPMRENGLENPLGRNKNGDWIQNRVHLRKPFQSGTMWNWPRVPRFMLVPESGPRNFACLPTLLVIYNNINQVDQMNVSLVDQEAYLPLFRESERRLRESGGSSPRPPGGAGVKL